MKKFFLIILLSLAVCHINAASLPFSVEPVKWTKLAKNNTDGVNIRKSPSTTAARYVYNPQPTDAADGEGYWSTAKLKGDEIVITFQGIAPVLSEVEGWNELKGIGPGGSNGWVNAKYCDLVNLKGRSQKVVPGEYNTPDLLWVRYKDGDLYCIYYEYNEMDGFCAFYIGREIDGYVVCPYCVLCQSELSYENKCGMIESDYGFEGSKHYRFLYGDSHSLNWMGFDLRKCTNEAIASIIIAASPMKDPVVIYRSDGSYVAVNTVPIY